MHSNATLRRLHGTDKKRMNRNTCTSQRRCQNPDGCRFLALAILRAALRRRLRAPMSGNLIPAFRRNIKCCMKSTAIKDMAAVADADTFHATNAAPQVQRFNGGLWGSIENYILANTKHDHMRLCVF